MLDEVIEYLKQLQAQVSMMCRMNLPSMMLPMAMQQQQQLQLSLMSGSMGLGLGMGMTGLGLLGLNSMNRAAATAPNIHTNMMPNPFVPMTSLSWDASSSTDTLFQSPLTHDPMPAFLSCSSQVIQLFVIITWCFILVWIWINIFPIAANDDGSI